MTVVPMVTRRLLRTKQAAAYLSMSEWKLRRLIQTEIIPFVQDRRGGPFLVDVRDLDAYIEGNKHNISDAHHREPNPVLTAPREASPQPEEQMSRRQAGFSAMSRQQGWLSRDFGHRFRSQFF